MTRQEQIENARKVVGENLGFSDFDGTAIAYKALSQKRQVQLTEGVAAYIKANPGDFPADAVDLAGKIVKGEAFATPLQDVSFGANVEQFKAEFAAEGGKLAERAGLSFASAIGVVAAIAGLVLAAPRLLAMLKK